MPVQTVTVGPGLLNIGEAGDLKALASQVTSATLTPSVDREDPIPVLSGETVAGDRTESWTLNGEFLQDFGYGDLRLSEYCFTNRGKSMPFEYVPNNEGDKKIVGTLTVEAINIGGDVKTKGRAEFEWEVLDPEIADIADEGV